VEEKKYKEKIRSQPTGGPEKKWWNFKKSEKKGPGVESK